MLRGAAERTAHSCGGMREPGTCARALLFPDPFDPCRALEDEYVAQGPGPAVESRSARRSPSRLGANGHRGQDRHSGRHVDPASSAVGERPPQPHVGSSWIRNQKVRDSHGPAGNDETPDRQSLFVDPRHSVWRRVRSEDGDLEAFLSEVSLNAAGRNRRRTVCSGCSQNHHRQEPQPAPKKTGRSRRDPHRPSPRRPCVPTGRPLVYVRPEARIDSFLSRCGEPLLCTTVKKATMNSRELLPSGERRS
jgi:hypothetical protein